MQSALEIHALLYQQRLIYATLQPDNQTLETEEKSKGNSDDDFKHMQ